MLLIHFVILELQIICVAKRNRIAILDLLYVSTLVLEVPLIP